MMTLAQTYHALIAGETTALEQLQLARDRIARLDGEGPALNAVLELNPQAEGIALAMDAEIREGKTRGPLHGVPVLLKDNIDTDDMMHTSAGSLALQGRFAPRDAFLVTKLREAGAVLLGKTNMTEFANYMADRMTNGYSSRGGQVKSPWGDTDPSGSSTGSAVAVAAGYVPLAIGTETYGSIISPSTQAGIVGLKPTVGVVSRRGVIPISASLDTAGPMARSVLDCAIALDVLCGPDAQDAHTLHGNPLGGYAKAVRTAPDSLKGMRFGLFNEDHKGAPQTAPTFRKALDALARLGAEIVETAPPPLPPESASWTMRGEFRACLEYALRGSAGCPATLAEIVEYNRAHRDTCLRYGQAVLERALSSQSTVRSPAYIHARQAIQSGYRANMERLFADGGFVAILTPECSSFAVGGYPSLALPVGTEGGFPVSLVFNGLAFCEKTLLRAAAALERIIGPGTLPQGVYI